jgi:hypothetical protein
MSIFSAVNVERSSRLHALVKAFVAKADAQNPPLSGFFLSLRDKEFLVAASRSRLIDNARTTFESARRFALGVTEGLGGDAFQRFLGTNTAWSHLVHRLKTHTAEAVSLEKIQETWHEKFGIDFAGLLLPLHSSLDGRVVLLFKWTEDDLMPTSSKGNTFYMACLARVTNANDTLKDIRTSLTVTDTTAQRAFCELLPRAWLLGGGLFGKNTRLADDIALSFEEVSAFGENARFLFETFGVIDGDYFETIQKEVEAIQKAETQKQIEKKKIRNRDRKPKNKSKTSEDH